MNRKRLTRFTDTLRLVRISARLVAGRRFWIAPLLPLLWLAFQAICLVFGWRDERFLPVHAQNTLIGLPLTVLAIGFGVRIIAGEIDRRTLEIAYTVPGGCQRVWLAKLAASFVMLAASEALLAIVVFVFFTDVPLSALYGAFQAAVFYMVAAMTFSAFFKSEITGAMGIAAALVLNGLFTGFGEEQLRISAFFNPLAVRNTDAEMLFAWTLQNHIGFVMAIAVITGLAFARAERREKLLGG